MRRLTCTLLLLTVVATTGCTEVLRQAYTPECTGETAEPPLILMAQAVPTASLVPCIEAMPAGWRYSKMEVRSGRAEIEFDHDRAGMGFLRVVMTRSCAEAVGSSQRSDEDGTTRFEVVDQVVGRYRATWIYVFAGGCATYEFDFDEADQSLQIEAAAALGFVTRAHLEEVVEDFSDGRLTL